MPVTIVNKYALKTSRYIKILRGTIFGNEFMSGRDGTHDEVIAKHRAWLKKQLSVETPIKIALDKLRERHLAGEQLNLCCVCAPRTCHGDSYKEYIETGALK